MGSTKLYGKLEIFTHLHSNSDILRSGIQPVCIPMKTFSIRLVKPFCMNSIANRLNLILYKLTFSKGLDGISI